MQQKYQSDKTSLNQVPATFKKLELQEGSVNLDFGGGKYDKATEFLKEKNVTNLVYDPFNRSELHNLKVRHAILKNNGADTFTVNNVLNVIQENSIVNHVIEQVSSSLKENGKGYFLVFEGDRSGIGRETTKGWQRNEKPQAYLEQISKHFENVKKRGIFIEANKPLNLKPNDGLFTFEAVYQDLLSIIKKEGIPTPNAKTKVGKEIGGNLYIHKSAKDNFPDGLLQQFEKHLPKDFEYEIIKWNKKENYITFLSSPNWDTTPEPIVGDSIKVDNEGNLKFMKQKSDPQIYHHKWNFVKPDYKGFDVLENMIRSLEWNQIPCDKAKIGTLSYWEEQVLSKMENPNIPKRKTHNP